MRRVTSLSLAPVWSRASRSRRMETSAKSRAGRVAVPAKITSSMPPPRSDLGLDSPIAQRIASSRFDLPQPFGPTTPVRPASILSSAGSTKLLNPLSLSRRIRNLLLLPLECPSAARGFLELRFQLLPRRRVDHLAVDEEGRRVIDARVFRCLCDAEQPFEPLRVGEALPRPCRRHPKARRDLRKARDLAKSGKTLCFGHLVHLGFLRVGNRA